MDLPFVAKVAALWENPDDGNYNYCMLAACLVSSPGTALKSSAYSYNIQHIYRYLKKLIKNWFSLTIFYC
jgi:hypothetical protein